MLNSTTISFSNHTPTVQQSYPESQDGKADCKTKSRTAPEKSKSSHEAIRNKKVMQSSDITGRDASMIIPGSQLQSKDVKLGMLSGVFVPTCLNVLSILMFLRFGFILGKR